jgi:uncharacterized protein (TIRG00374 family)
MAALSNSRFNTYIKWIASIAIGLLFVWLAFREWPISSIAAGGIRLEDGWVTSNYWRVSVLTLCLYFLTLISLHLFRFWRWQPLLKPLYKVDFWTLNRVCSIGNMAVFLLPMRLGELVRPMLISTETPIRKSSALATIVVERVVDGIIVAGFLAVALVFMPKTNIDSYLEIKIGTWITLIVFGTAVAVLILMFAFRRQVSVFAHNLAGRFSSGGFAFKIAGMMDRFMTGLSVFPDARNFLLFLAMSLAYWCSNGFGLWILAHGFQMHSAAGWVPLGVPLLGAFAMMSTIVVGMMIPNAPANIGSFWYFLLKPMELYGIEAGNPAALSFALTVWSLQLLQLLVFGGYFIIRGQVSFKRAFAIGSQNLDVEELVSDSDDGEVS